MGADVASLVSDFTCLVHLHVLRDYIYIYRGADKSFARPWKETSYSDQDIQHKTKTYGVKTTGIYCCLYTP